MARTVCLCVCVKGRMKICIRERGLSVGKGEKEQRREEGEWYCFLYVEISRIFIASHCGNSFKSLLASALLFLLLF